MNEALEPQFQHVRPAGALIDSKSSERSGTAVWMKIKLSLTTPESIDDEQINSTTTFRNFAIVLREPQNKYSPYRSRKITCIHDRDSTDFSTITLGKNTD
jgi:hypothetical protein